MHVGGRGLLGERLLLLLLKDRALEVLMDRVAVCQAHGQTATSNGRERCQLSKEIIIVVILSHLLNINHFLDVFLQVFGQRIIFKEGFHE